MFDRLRRPSQSEGPQLALDMEPLSLQSHMRTHLHYYQEGQGKPLTAPFTSEKSEVEILSEDRLYARRKRRHEEAMGTHNDAAKTEDLFNQKVDEASMKWTDGVHPPSTDSKAYVKLVSPSGKLTKEVAKDLLQRLKIPVKTEMGVLMQHMYKHYFYGSETTVPKIDKKEAASKAIFTTLRESGYAGAKATSDGSLIASVYTNFKRLMNDPTTFDTLAIQTRNRVQGDPSKPVSDYILPIPKTKSGKDDKRYTAGDYNSARDLLNRRKYMSVAGGPFGGYQADLLDMGVRGKPYNDQFWYLLTLINTNSRYVYACPIKKGEDQKRGQTDAQRRALKELSDDIPEPPNWIERQIIPAFELIMIQIDKDIAQGQAVGQDLSHRKITNIMVDAGSEIQLKLRKWLVDQGISTQVCEPETHEEMTRLNSFHRYFRSRYQMQWRKFFEDRREYGGPVQWISPKANELGFAGLSSTVLTSSDATAVVSADELKTIEEKGDVKVIVPHSRTGDTKGSVHDVVEDEFQFQEEADNEPIEQKEARVTGRWHITYWEDWLNSHNQAVKSSAFRGAELVQGKNGVMRVVNVAKSPSVINDAMVHNLIRVDAAKREVVKERVNAWIKVHNVLTEEDLSPKDQAYATRVRLDLNRTKFGKELKQKGTTFLSIWSKRHYALRSRQGTNTFEVRHEHGIDFPRIWPMYRMRVVTDPSNVSQPFDSEVQVNPGQNEDWRDPDMKSKADEDVTRLIELQQAAKEEEKVQKLAEDSLNDLNKGVTFAPGAQVDEEVASSAIDQKTEQSQLDQKNPKKAKKEVIEQEQEEDRMMTRAMAVKNYDQTARIKMSSLPLSQGDVLPDVPKPKKSHKKKLPVDKLPVDRPQKQSDASKKSHKKKVPVAQKEETKQSDASKKSHKKKLR